MIKYKAIRVKGGEDTYTERLNVALSAMEGDWLIMQTICHSSFDVTIIFMRR